MLEEIIVLSNRGSNQISDIVTLVTEIVTMITEIVTMITESIYRNRNSNHDNTEQNNHGYSHRGGGRCKTVVGPPQLLVKHNILFSGSRDSNPGMLQNSPHSM